MFHAWGEVLNITGTMADTLGQTNPIRYRGYYYDTETGLYYVSSRFYDPVTHRFISSDVTDVLTATPMALTDKNLFAYCDNNPVIRIDREGQFWDTIFDVISLCGSIVEVCVNPTDPWAWAGLAGDVVDLIPFVTGVGETTRAIKTVNRVADVVDDVAETSDAVYDVSRRVDFYVTPDGDAIPSTLLGFNNNLSKMDNINGKYYGYDSRGPVRIRVEMHGKKLGYKGPINPYHEVPHFHIDRKIKVTSGSWVEKFTDFLGGLF